MKMKRVPATHAPHSFSGFINAGQNLCGSLGKDLAGFRKFDTPSASIEKAGTHFVFKLTDLAAQGLLSEKKPVRRTREVQFLCYRDESLYVADLHSFSLSESGPAT
ncbi:hypothetical protein OOZ51_18665 [Arthrobacter sp. MI7-26]|nr:hypothetical protein [Arthrobacter sp. MI7-26]MCX2749816.1 hypothetical protein [Arthrobacter sp. MI7-26]